MRKQFFFTLCLVLMVSTPALTSQPDTSGKDIIRKFSEKMKSLQSIKATFNFTLENLKEKIADTYEGKLLLKGKKYNMELMGMDVYFDGATKWQYIPEVNEVTISTPNSQDNNFFDDPSQIFSDYEKDFKSKLISERVVGGKSICEVDLYPNDLNADYSIIKLKFEKASLEPISIKYQGKDGNNYIISVKNFKANQPTRDEEFVFDPKGHRGLEIVDLR